MLKSACSPFQIAVKFNLQNKISNYSISATDFRNGNVLVITENKTKLTYKILLKKHKSEFVSLRIEHMSSIFI